MPAQQETNTISGQVSFQGLAMSIKNTLVLLRNGWLINSQAAMPKNSPKIRPQMICLTIDTPWSNVSGRETGPKYSIIAHPMALNNTKLPTANKKRVFLDINTYTLARFNSFQLYYLSLNLLLFAIKSDNFVVQL